MTAETLYVTPDYALRDTIIVLVGVVVGGLDRLWTAALGGFAIGFVTGVPGFEAADLRSWPSTSTSTPRFSASSSSRCCYAPTGSSRRRHRAVERV